MHLFILSRISRGSRPEQRKNKGVIRISLFLLIAKLQLSAGIIESTYVREVVAVIVVVVGVDISRFTGKE